MSAFWNNFRAYRRLAAGKSASERLELRALLRMGPIGPGVLFASWFAGGKTP